MLNIVLQFTIIVATTIIFLLIFTAINNRLEEDPE